MLVKDLIGILETFDEYEEVLIDNGIYGMAEVASVHKDDEEGAIVLESE